MTFSEYSVTLCGSGCCGCPAVELSQSGVTIGEGGNSVRLTREEWNVLVDKVKVGELAAVGPAPASESCVGPTPGDDTCGCGCSD